MFPMLEARPTGNKAKLFFAFLPPADSQTIIAGLRGILQQAHGLHGHVMSKDRLHMTLVRVADPRQTREAAIADAIAIAATLRHCAVPVYFDQTQSFRSENRYPLVLSGGRPPPVCSFRHLLADRLRRAGFAVDPGFTPHVTMLWADRRVSDYPIAPIEWTAREFVLVESGQGRHVHLARWALG